MMIAEATLNQCLRAVGVYAPKCRWTGNPLGTILALGRLAVIAVGVWAMFYRRAPRTGRDEPSGPDEDGFYPLKNQV